MKVGSSRAAPVCLVLLCALLLTAVIVLGVSLHDMIEEFYIKNKNLTDEIKELKNRKSNLDNDIKNLKAKKKTLIPQNEKSQKQVEELWQQIRKMGNKELQYTKITQIFNIKRTQSICFGYNLL